MITSMVTFNDDYMVPKPRTGNIGIQEKHETHTTNLFDLPSANTSHMPTEASNVPSATAMGNLMEIPERILAECKKDKMSTYLDMPLLISDHDGEDSEGESSNGVKNSSADEVESVNPALSATQEVKRSIREEKAKEEIPEDAKILSSMTENRCETTQTELSVDKPLLPAKLLPVVSETDYKQSALSPESFNCERNKVMKIVVKYVAMKITNSFPPQSSRNVDPTEMPLDEYLMILVSRLQLSLPLFMKGIIYLFRYMDIIYLLRYVNQSNNFANYTDMGYGLKKLIIGCYRLVLARERRSNDWSKITGLSNAQINDIVKTVVGRLNGKLLIKNVELIRLRSEIFRFVKMVTKTV